MNINDATYMLLGTRKKDGTIVNTPVWFAKDEQHYFVFTARNSGKVKRLRNFTDVKVAPCTVNGKPLADGIETTAELIDAQQSTQKARNCLLNKYGWQMRILDFFSWLSGNYNKRQFIQIALPGNTPQAE